MEVLTSEEMKVVIALGKKKNCYTCPEKVNTLSYVLKKSCFFFSEQVKVVLFVQKVNDVTFSSESSCTFLEKVKVLYF